MNIKLPSNTDNNGGDSQEVTKPFVEKAAENSLHQQQLAFSDANAGTEEDFATTSVSGFDSSGISGVDLGDFLKRPVLIDSYDWTEGNFFAHSFDPWTLFLTNSVIKKKLDNYGLIRGNLRLKFLISASPFYYSTGLISYNPMPETHQGPNIVVASDVQLVTYSQRPHIFIDPTTSTGGELCLPFFYDQNWLENKTESISRMGQIRYDSFIPLRNANSVAGANVTVRCYAWSDDMQLSAPTVQLQGSSARRKKKSAKTGSMMDRVGDFAAGRDEYGDGPVSNVASAVATAASALSNVPVIGPFARATEIGAGALSRVAAWFGYTNVPVISDVMPFKDLPFGGFASSEIAGPTPKLTLDPKNELTLDSRTVGLDGTDELSLESYVGHESYISVFDWDTTDSSNSILWSSGVNPSDMYRNIGATCWLTPMAHAASMYQYWTGSLVFTFKIIATPYHRGRIKITFDPSALNDISTVAFDETANITRIFDIGETQDIELIVPYMQAKPFLENHTLELSNASILFNENRNLILNNGDVNGYIQVAVVSELTSPIADAPVSIAVFVKPGDDFKLMGPIAPPLLAQWTIQSSMSPVYDSMGDTGYEEPELNLVYGGESAVSLRQLLHRHCYVRSFGQRLDDNSYMSTFSMYPLSLNNNDDTRNIHSVANGTFNYVNNSFLSWISPSFAGKRGSIYWAVNMNGDISNKTSFYRAPLTPSLPNTYDLSIAYNVGDAQQYSYGNLTNNTLNLAGNGVALYNSSTQTGTTVLVPFISSKRFVGTHASHWDPGTTTNRLGYENLSVKAHAITLNYIDKNFGGEYYCASGPDFNLFFFTGVPTITLLNSIQVPQ